MKKLSYCVLSSFLLSSCTLLTKTAKTELTDGFYTQKTPTGRDLVYIDKSGDSLRIHKTYKQNGKSVVDTTMLFDLFLGRPESKDPRNVSLSQTSFDIDLITIPIKFRPKVNNLPAQLNSNISAALYCGYRTDKYVINYKRSPLNLNERSTNHLGLSIGGFSGLGNSEISPTTTNGLTIQDYSGMVWSNGVATIVGVNNFTIGLTLGMDHLLNTDRRIWAYQNKLWVGIALGLNLN